jgi:hypothetical protein
MRDRLLDTVSAREQNFFFSRPKKMETTDNSLLPEKHVSDSEQDTIHAADALLELNHEDESLIEASDVDSSEDSDDDEPPFDPPLVLHLLQKTMRIEKFLVHHLESVFNVAMSDVESHPSLLFLLGICAGGFFGFHIAAFSIGYVFKRVLSTYAHVIETAFMVIMVGDTFTATGSLRAFPSFCFGRDLQSFFSTGRLTPKSAAVMSIDFVGIVSPTHTTLSLICLISIYSAFCDWRR